MEVVAKLKQRYHFFGILCILAISNSQVITKLKQGYHFFGRIACMCVLCVYSEMRFGHVDTLGQYVSEFDPEPDSTKKGIGI